MKSVSSKGKLTSTLSKAVKYHSIWLDDYRTFGEHFQKTKERAYNGTDVQCRG